MIRMVGKGVGREAVQVVGVLSLRGMQWWGIQIEVAQGTAKFNRCSQCSPKEGFQQVSAVKGRHSNVGLGRASSMIRVCIPLSRAKGVRGNGGDLWLHGVESDGVEPDGAGSSGSGLRAKIHSSMGWPRTSCSSTKRSMRSSVMPPYQSPSG